MTVETKVKTLQEILKENDLNILENPKYGTDKGDPKPYVDHFYEENFSKIRDNELTIVEIGVRSGASICLWKNYFSNAKIYGVDNLYEKNELKVPVNDEWVSGDNIEYVIGDGYSQETADKIPNNIDIFIDDGPHTVESHIKALELYLPKMSENGIFIIEDISYNVNSVLYDKVPEEYREYGTVYDFGPYEIMFVLDMSKKAK